MAPPKRRGTSTSISEGDGDGAARKHTRIKTYAHKQQGEVKAINVSELAMHHTSALIDRWHQESVPHTHTHIQKKREQSREEKVHTQGQR